MPAGRGLVVADTNVFGAELTRRGRPIADGAVDFGAVLRALDVIGADPVAAAVVFNTELVAAGIGSMAHAVRDHCTTTLQGMDAT